MTWVPVTGDVLGQLGLLGLVLRAFLGVQKWCTKTDFAWRDLVRNKPTVARMVPTTREMDCMYYLVTAHLRGAFPKGAFSRS